MPWIKTGLESFFSQSEKCALSFYVPGRMKKKYLIIGLIENDTNFHEKKIYG